LGSEAKEPLSGRKLAFLRFYFDSLIQPWMTGAVPILSFASAAARVGKRDAELAIMFRYSSGRRSRIQNNVFRATVDQLSEDVAEWHRINRDEFFPFCVAKEKESRRVAEALFSDRVDQHDLLLLRYLYEVQSEPDVLRRFHERWMTMLADDVGQSASDSWLNGKADPFPIMKKMTAIAQKTAEHRLELADA
jgi:hypothetical protein